MTVMTFRGFAGARLEAEVSGSGDDPAVLLVHGAGQTRDVWSQVAAALVAAGRRVINLDMRGHGSSEWPGDGLYTFDAFAEDLRCVLAQLATRPVIVATSLGGWAAITALAIDATHLATGLVLADLPTDIDLPRAKVIGDRLKRGVNDIAGTMDWDPRVIDAIDITDVPQRLAAAAPEIRLPVLFVRGDASPLVTERDAANFVRLLPDAEFAKVDDARLLVTVESIDRFNALLLDFLERRAPRQSPEFRAGTDPRTLRDALGCFATGVTIVTALDGDGAPIGLTANSFTSVSLDPPLLLVCIAKTAGSGPALRDATHFAVNVLQIGQQPASNRFASKGEDRFAGLDWHPGETGVPVLSGSLSAFECGRHAVHDGGDHYILIGRVVCARFEPRRDPLLYFRGKYRRLHFA
ncbi:MAG: alpha/beta fold hydrolase [Sphingomonas sp.]